MGGRRRGEAGKTGAGQQDRDQRDDEEAALVPGAARVARLRA